MLTIFGITIGVLALVVMGGMAEKINMLVSGGTEYYSDKVTVQAAGTSLFSSSAALPRQARRHQGSARRGRGLGRRSACCWTPRPGASFGMPAMIGGSDMLGDRPGELQDLLLRRAGAHPRRHRLGGAGLRHGQEARRQVGGTVTVRGEQFKVVGILDKTLTAPDTSVWMTLPDAQRLFMQDIPEVVRGQVNPSDLVTSFVVYPTPGTDPETLATAHQRGRPGVKATGPQAFQDQIASTMGIFNAILYGIAIIALFVGGLSVINTMTMSVNERTREIGVRKAIGASDGQIVRQFLSESGVIGLIGGVSGLFLGWLAATVADKLLESRNLDLFLVTPRLAIGSVLFALFLGLVSGLYPSLHAARLQPVVALRYE